MPPAAESLPVENGSISMGPTSHHDTLANHGTGAAIAAAGSKPSPKKLMQVTSSVSCLDVSFSFKEGLSPAAEAALASSGLSTGTCNGAEVAPSTDDTVPVLPSSSSRLATSAQPAQPASKRPSTWQVEPSELCLRTVNPIRKITDAAPAPATSAAPKKSTISLGQGDPTVFGHLAVSKEAAEAVAEALLSGRVNGYTPSFGLPDARQAVATYLTSLSGPSGGPSFSPEDVYITSGCGHSFQLCLEALSNPGKNVLLPRPGFPVYDCWCAAAGVEIRRYSLLPEKNWEVDLEEVRQLADENTVAILICHPGNPCGNVFSKEHLREILEVAECLKLPIISDEIYGGISFYGSQFTPTVAAAAEPRACTLGLTADLAGVEGPEGAEGAAGGAGAGAGARAGAGAGAGVGSAALVGGTALAAAGSAGKGFSVPIFTVSSISKTLLVPGWRLGWIALHDPKGILKASRVQEALENRLQFTTLTCSLIQAALPRILLGHNADFFRGLNASLEDSLQLSLERIAEIPGLDCPSQPQGGMFLMVRIDLSKFKGLPSDVAWCRALLAEESVVLIPGTAFEFPGWFRTLISAPRGILEEAWERIAQFCTRHCSTAQ